MSSTRDELTALGVRPNRVRGQNFLERPEFAYELVRFSGVASDDMVVEIGPGLGILTSALLKQIRDLTVIELQSEFVGHLRQKFPNITVIEGDARKIGWNELGQKKPIHIVTNLPYSISSEVIQLIIENRSVIASASLLLQRDFAERIAARPGGRDYGSLTVFAQLYAEAKLGAVVPPEAFWPAPKVESQFLKLTLSSTPRVSVDDPVWMERVVRAAFSQRRKTLLNSLSSGLGVSRDELTRLIGAAFDLTRRAETFSLEEFSRLATATAGMNPKR